VRLLLDTHVLLWALTDDRRLGAAARDLLEDPRTLVHVSAASIWEVSIKSALGRLELDGADLVAEVGEAGFGALVISAAHAWAAGQLPPHHRDPFDRLLVAQTRLEGLVLATADTTLQAYDVQILDCSS
jgi:PIN domain nuclease of toxin-antitoxin system